MSLHVCLPRHSLLWQPHYFHCLQHTISSDRPVEQHNLVENQSSYGLCNGHATACNPNNSICEDELGIERCHQQEFVSQLAVASLNIDDCRQEKFQDCSSICQRSDCRKQKSEPVMVDADASDADDSLSSATTQLLSCPTSPANGEFRVVSDESTPADTSRKHCSDLPAFEILGTTLNDAEKLTAPRDSSALSLLTNCHGFSVV